MLSKLLSNISGKNITSGEEIIGSNKEEGGNTSKEVFQSLLQSLQNQNSSDKAKQQLLALSDSSSEQAESPEGEDVQKNILGGSFTAIGAKEADNLLQADHNILKELQKEFQNIKNELIGDTSDSPSADGKEDEDQNGVSESGEPQVVEGSEVDAKEKTSGEGTEAQLSEELDENGEVIPKGQAQENGESTKTDSEKESAKQEHSTKVNLGKQAAGNLEGDNKESTESGSKKGATRIDGAAENVKGIDGDSQKDKEKAELSVSSKKGELSQEKQQANLSTDKKEGVQHGSATTLREEQATTKEVEESREQTSQKKGIENRNGDMDSRGKAFEKAQRFAGRQAQQDTMNQVKEEQRVRNKNVEPGKAQAGVQFESGQTAKTELTEQQKKVMDSFFQKRDPSNISTKGLEMKSVQKEKGKNAKGNNEAENSKQGLGKESSEGRNKLLNRLGISGSNAQKQAKPLDLQNFSGVTVGESNSSLEEQKINWEDQLTKTMDSATEKESKAGSASSSVRLGQIPITNGSLRKKILPGLTQRIQQAASSSKGDSSNWQTHNFTLDDGKNIQLSVRESKGVLQVKMGSMNLDLSKLLQQNLQQIREHLKQEFGSEVDLHFENQQQGEESQFSEDTESLDRKRNYRNNFGAKGVTVETAEDVSRKTVRNFGYNQMEWTA
ncbi:hypothetical protein CK503_07450 [Aliifodinibius salipaludis]|uniref:Uncharacterized protein n=1 Tax=Fodinibius salipaludis TaxID=2032627 RepID=A0A2A2GAL5_9BACT|nr:hypothetical protein [Aliifodinibius salipaludis]PAU94621.1 hypothetical protein CK503_07450 [Aliifodinibius salipaludis]